MPNQTATQVIDQQQKDLDAAASMFILLTKLMNRAKVSNDRARDRDYWDCFGLLRCVETASPEIAKSAKAWMEADPNGLAQYEPKADVISETPGMITVPITDCFIHDKVLGSATIRQDAIISPDMVLTLAGKILETSDTGEITKFKLTEIGLIPPENHAAYQPIGTAPKDGTEILLWFPELGWEKGLWNGDLVNSADGWSLQRDYYGPAPTHWDHLPKPPSK
jgi:hypothetical protein